MSLVEHSEEKSSRDKILDVAEALFARRGYAGVGLREVAEGVGLQKSSIFHHFDSKAGLYTAVSLRILGTIEDKVVRSLARGGPPRRRLERVVGDLVDVLAGHPHYARLLLRSLFEDDDLPQEGAEATAVKLAITGITGPVGKLLKEGMGVGEFRLASPSHLILLLVGTVVFPFSSREFGEDVLGDDVFDAGQVSRLKSEILDLVRHGLTAWEKPHA